MPRGPRLFRAISSSVCLSSSRVPGLNFIIPCRRRCSRRSYACVGTERFVLLGKKIQQLAHVASIVEQLSLQLSRQRIPLNNKRSSKTSQNLILGCKGRSICLVLLSAIDSFFLEVIHHCRQGLRDRESHLELLELLSFS